MAILSTEARDLILSLRRPIQESLVALNSEEVQGCVLESPELLTALAQEAALLSARLSDLIPTHVRDGRAPLVVLVDDERSALNALRELLTPGFEVLATTDPHEALEWIRTHRPDAVVTDLRMPEMNGHSLLQVLRGDQMTADMPCLVVSASVDIQDRVTALEQGAADFVPKPINADELAARIRNAIVRARTLRKERALGETDELTALPNRRAFKAFIQQAIVHAEVVGEPLAVAMIDQDRLKQINDTYGHPAGDEAIRALANALMSRKRATDLVARIGGDEFVLVLPRTDAQGVRKMLSEVAAKLAALPFFEAMPDLRVSFSFGVAVLGETGAPDSWEQLLARADQALYGVKRRAARDRAWILLRAATEGLKFQLVPEVRGRPF